MDENEDADDGVRFEDEVGDEEADEDESPGEVAGFGESRMGPLTG